MKIMSGYVPLSITFLAIVMTIAGTVMVLSGLNLAHSHTGMVASDGCHNDRAAGERHWHLDGGVERGGRCGKSGEGPAPRVSDDKCVIIFPCDSKRPTICVEERRALESALQKTFNQAGRKSAAERLLGCLDGAD